MPRLSASPPNSGRGRLRSPGSDGSEDAVVVRGRRQERRNPSVSDGEASLGSDAMSESESEAEPSKEVDVAKLYPIEGKFADEADRSRILAMTEVDREAILADRDREMERHLQNQQLRQLLNQRKRENTSILGDSLAAKKRKRRGASPDSDDRHGGHDSDDGKNRNRGRDNRTKLEEFRRLRQRQDDQGRNRQGRSASNASSRSIRSSTSIRSGISDDGYGGANDSDRDRYSDEDGHYSRKRSQQEEQSASLGDFEKVRVGRSYFGRYCFNPTFEDALIGCFCRVVVGVDERTKQNIYEMAQIEGFVEKEDPYPLDGDGGKPFLTNYRVILSFGRKERERELNVCSNSRFTDAEFDHWKKACATDKSKIASLKQLENKTHDMKKLETHKWTDVDINKKLLRKSKFSYAEHMKKKQHTNDPDNNKGGEPEVDSLSKADRLSRLNDANREANRKIAIQAHIKQRRDILRRGDAAAAAAAARTTADLSASDMPKNGTAGGEPTAVVVASSRIGSMLKREKVGTSSVMRAKTDDEMIGELNLDIDVVI